MGHTRLIDHMSHNTAIQRLDKRTGPAAPEEMKRYFHHPYGMAYYIDGEWVPCPGYEESSAVPISIRERPRKTTLETWRPKKPAPPTVRPKVICPPREELDRLVEKQGLSLAAISRLKKCSVATVHNWFKQHKLKTPSERKKLAKEKQS